jgi:hypothetical protein
LLQRFEQPCWRNVFDGRYGIAPDHLNIGVRQILSHRQKEQAEMADWKGACKSKEKEENHEKHLRQSRAKYQMGSPDLYGNKYQKLLEENSFASLRICHIGFIGIGCFYNIFQIGSRRVFAPCETSKVAY